MVVGKSRSNGIRVILIVSVAGGDLFIFGVDRGPGVHGGLGAMPVARWSASIEWSIVVEHRTDTGEIETINHIGVHGALLGF